MGFQASTHPFAYTMVNSPETGDSIYLRTVSPQIPDRILQTGNRRVLENFYFQNREKLTAADKRYLGARLHTAALVDRLEKKALEDLAEGKPRPTPEITTKRGYQGINMKMPRCQSSNNGCWSCGMEMLFRSRGVDITQEEIRAYRPDYPEGQEKMSKERQYAANRDTGASLYDCGDLLLKVLPNACLRCQEFQPLEQPESMSLYDSNGKRVWNEDLQKAAAAQQKQQLKEQFVASIRQGLLTDKSPVVLNRGGSHFVTITGISKDGKKIRFEDSFPTSFGTKYATVDELIDKYMAPGMHGLGLTWVRDLPVPKKNLAEDKTQLLSELGDGVTIDKTGAITLSQDGVPEGKNVAFAGNPNQAVGMLAGTEANQMIYMDQKELLASTGCSLRNQGIADDKPMHMIVNDNSYLPKRTWLPGDPEIRKELEAREAREKELDLSDAEKALTREEYVVLDSAEMPVLDPRDPKEEPAAGSLDAFEANQKHSLLQQAEGTASFLANLYALQVYRTSREKQQKDTDAQQKFVNAEKLRGQIDTTWEQPDGPDKTALIQKQFGDLTKMYPHLERFLDRQTGMPTLRGEALKAQLEIGREMEKNLITADLQKKLDAAAATALPVIKDMLGEKYGSVELPMTAVHKDPQELVNQIDGFAKDRYYIPPNPEKQPRLPDWEEKRQVISSAVTILRATGTGKNALGITRKQNSPSYDRMLNALEEYSQKLQDPRTAPSGMENRKLIQHMLDYVSNKMELRSNESSGQRRFDTVMGVLRETMPARQFDRLVRKINQTRGAVRGDKSYVTADSYAPMTADRFCAQKSQQLLTATGSTFKKLCATVLAARQIAQENERKGKTLILDPADPTKQQLLVQKTKQLLQDPRFESTLNEIPQGQTQEDTILNRQYYIGTGETLLNHYNKAAAPQMIQSAPNA